MPKSKEPRKIQRIRAAQQKKLSTRAGEYLKDSFSTPDKALQFLLMLTDKPDIGPATLASRIPYVFFPAAATALSGGTAGILMLLIMISFVFYGGIHDFIQKDRARINELNVGSIPEMYARALEESEINSEGYGHDTNIGNYLAAFHEIERLEDEIATLKTQHDALVTPPKEGSINKKVRSSINKQKDQLMREIRNKQREIDAQERLIKTEEEAIQDNLDQSQQFSQKKFLYAVDFDNHRIIGIDNPHYKQHQTTQLAINEDELDLEAQPLLAKSNDPSESLPFFKRCIDTLGPYIGMGINFIALGAMTNWLVWWGGKLGWGNAADGFTGSSIINITTITIPTLVAGAKLIHVIYERGFKERDEWSHVISAHKKEELQFVAKLDLRSIFRTAFRLTKASYGNALEKLNISTEPTEQIENAPTIDSYLTEDWRKHLSRLATFDRGPRGMYVLTQFAVAGAASILGWLATCANNQTLADAASSATEMRASFGISVGVAIITAIVHGYERLFFDNKQLPADIQKIFDTPMGKEKEDLTLRKKINELSQKIEGRLQAIEQLKTQLSDQELREFQTANLDDVIKYLNHKKPTALTIWDLGHEVISAAGSYIYILRSVLGLIFNSSTFDSKFFDLAVPIGLIGAAIRLITCYSEMHEARKHDIIAHAHEIALLLEEKYKVLGIYHSYLCSLQKQKQTALSDDGLIELQEVVDIPISGDASIVAVQSKPKERIHIRSDSDPVSDDGKPVAVEHPSHPRLVGIF